MSETSIMVSSTERNRFAERHHNQRATEIQLEEIRKDWKEIERLLMDMEELLSIERDYNVIVKKEAILNELIQEYASSRVYL